MLDGSSLLLAVCVYGYCRPFVLGESYELGWAGLGWAALKSKDNWVVEFSTRFD